MTDDIIHDPTGDPDPGTPQDALTAAGRSGITVVVPGTPLSAARLAPPGRIPTTPNLWGAGRGTAAAGTPPRWTGTTTPPKTPLPGGMVKAPATPTYADRGEDDPPPAPSTPMPQLRVNPPAAPYHALP
eukprot:7852942-Prorocentrum_lima.AAC.1